MTMKEGVNSEERAQASEAISFERTLRRMSVPEFDAQEFRGYVDDLDITEEQKIEVLKALWAIAVAFVDLGFRTEPTQQVIPALAQFLVQSESLADFSGQSESEGVQKNIPVQQFNDAAKDGD